MKGILDYIIDNNIGEYKEDVSFAKNTTYRSGGNAKLFVYPKDQEKLILLIKKLRKEKIKFKVLGCGSNTLFSDDDYDGVIVKLDKFDNITFFKNTVIAEAGVKIMKLVGLTVKRRLAGLEFAAGVPGTVGGAVFMNAGCYGSDMGYVTKWVKVLTPKYEIIRMTNKEMDFHYRTSFLQKHPDYICLEAAFQLRESSRELLQEIIDDRRKRRLECQPLEYPSAGSVFRNPGENIYAGKLIEDLGLKGYTIGGAKVSEKHANFIINYNNATSKDIKDLIDYVKSKVKEAYDIDLKIEQEFVNWE